MKKNIIATANAPAAIGPYSQAIDCGSFIVTSGQIPIDPATGNLVEGGITAQTRQPWIMWLRPPCFCRIWLTLLP